MRHSTCTYIYKYLRTGRAIQHSCTCAYALRAGDTRYNCSYGTSVGVSFFSFPYLSAGLSSVISAGRAGGTGPLLCSSPMRPHPLSQRGGLETCARVTAKLLHHGLHMRLRGGSYRPPRDVNVCLDVLRWAEDQGSSHGKLLTTQVACMANRPAFRRAYVCTHKICTLTKYTHKAVFTLCGYYIATSTL